MTGRPVRPDEPTPRDGYQPSNWPQQQAALARTQAPKATGPPPKGPEGGQGNQGANKGQPALDQASNAVPAARTGAEGGPPK